MIRIAIIEDSRQLREALRQLIGGSEGYQISGAFRSMEEALEQINRQPADVILVDIGLPGMSGIEGIPLLRARCPAARVVVLTVYSDDDRIFRALCAGACGYLLKKTAPARLLESLHEAVNGGGPMSPEVAAQPDALELCLSGGEDYELVFGLRPGKLARLQARLRELGVPLTVIGRALAGRGLCVERLGATVLVQPGHRNALYPPLLQDISLEFGIPDRECFRGWSRPRSKVAGARCPEASQGQTIHSFGLFDPAQFIIPPRHRPPTAHRMQAARCRGGRSIARTRS